MDRNVAKAGLCSYRATRLRPLRPSQSGCGSGPGAEWFVQPRHKTETAPPVRRGQSIFPASALQNLTALVGKSALTPALESKTKARPRLARPGSEWLVQPRHKTETAPPVRRGQSIFPASALQNLTGLVGKSGLTPALESKTKKGAGR